MRFPARKTELRLEVQITREYFALDLLSCWRSALGTGIQGKSTSERSPSFSIQCSFFLLTVPRRFVGCSLSVTIASTARDAQRVANEVSSTVDNMTKEK